MNCSAKDLGESAEVFLNELLQLRPGENLLLYVDRGSDHRVAQVIMTHAERRGCQAEILEVNSALPLAEQAHEITKRIRQRAFHAICELSEQYFYHSDAWPEARKAGARLYSLSGLDAQSFVRCVGRVNHRRLFQFGMLLKRRLQKSRWLGIFTPNGTDIRMQLGLSPLTRLISKWQRRPRAFIATPSGFLHRGASSAFLSGQLAFQGIPSTIEGTAVIDTYLWPPAEIGQLENPLVLRIEKGVVVEISGCPIKSEVLARWFERQTIRVEHFCIGFNPGARVSGKILEVERAFGCISVGMGAYPYHTDGVIKRPSIKADQGMIEDSGSFVTEELRPLERELRAASSRLLCHVLSREHRMLLKEIQWALETDVSCEISGSPPAR